MTTCELRKKAAALLQERGWCRDSYGEFGAGPLCLVGALCVAEGRSTTANTKTGVAHAAILSMRIRGVHDDYDAIHWNDRKCRTKEQVIARLLDGCEDGR